MGFLFFVIRSIVLNQVDSVVTAVEGGHDHLWLANCYFALVTYDSPPSAIMQMRHPTALFIHRYPGPLA